MAQGVSTRGDIERALIVLLGPLSIASGGYLRFVGHYNGELDASQPGLDAMQRRLLGQQPAVLVTTSRRSFESKGLRRGRAVVSLEVFLVVVSAHLRSHEARNLGDGALDAMADPGIYQILEDCQRLIWGVDLGVVGASAARPISEVFLAQAPELTAWRAHYAVEHDARPLAEVGVPLASIHHDHNLENAEAVNPVIRVELPPEVSHG
jgi:phage gp37-like protein